MEKKKTIILISLIFFNSHIQAGRLNLGIKIILSGLAAVVLSVNTFFMSYQIFQNKNTTKKEMKNCKIAEGYKEINIETELKKKIKNENDITIEIDSMGVCDSSKNWCGINSDGKGILMQKKNDRFSFEYVWSHTLPKSERIIYAKDMFKKIKFIETACCENNTKVNFILNGQSHAGNLFLLIDKINKEASEKNKIKSSIILNTFGTPIQKTTKTIAANQTTFKKINHFYYQDDITQQLDCISDGIKLSGIFWALTQKGSPGSQAKFINKPEDKAKYKNLEEFDVSNCTSIGLNHANFLKFKKDLVF